MINKKLKYLIQRIKENKYLTRDETNYIIKVLEQQPCEDVISRQAVIHHICEEKFCYVENCKGDIYKRCPDIMWVYDLPPVQPTRKRGKWVEYENGKGIECSECCVRWDFSENMTERFEFCPNCGSYNREVGE